MHVSFIRTTYPNMPTTYTHDLTCKCPSYRVPIHAQLSILQVTAIKFALRDFKMQSVLVCCMLAYTLV